MLIFGHSMPFVLDLLGLGHLLDVLVGMLMHQQSYSLLVCGILLLFEENLPILKRKVFFFILDARDVNGSGSGRPI